MGNFSITENDYLINKEGDYVMDMKNRRIRITRNPLNDDPKQRTFMDYTKDLVIGEDGQIQINNPEYQATLQKIQICDFEDKTKVSTLGEGKFVQIQNMNAGLYTKSKGFALQQGMLEMSNTNSVTEMIHSINVSRSYETLTNILKTQSTTLEKAIALGNLSG